MSIITERKWPIHLHNLACKYNYTDFDVLNKFNWKGLCHNLKTLLFNHFMFDEISLEVKAMISERNNKKKTNYTGSLKLVCKDFYKLWCKYQSESRLIELMKISHKRRNFDFAKCYLSFITETYATSLSKETHIRFKSYKFYDQTGIPMHTLIFSGCTCKYKFPNMCHYCCLDYEDLQDPIKYKQIVDFILENDLVGRRVINVFMHNFNPTDKTHNMLDKNNETFVDLTDEFLFSLPTIKHKDIVLDVGSIDWIEDIKHKIKLEDIILQAVKDRNLIGYEIFKKYYINNLTYSNDIVSKLSNSFKIKLLAKCLYELTYIQSTYSLGFKQKDKAERFYHHLQYYLGLTDDYIELLYEYVWLLDDLYTKQNDKKDSEKYNNEYMSRNVKLIILLCITNNLTQDDIDNKNNRVEQIFNCTRWWAIQKILINNNILAKWCVHNYKKSISRAYLMYKSLIPFDNVTFRVYINKFPPSNEEIQYYLSFCNDKELYDCLLSTKFANFDLYILEKLKLSHDNLFKVFSHKIYSNRNLTDEYLVKLSNFDFGIYTFELATKIISIDRAEKVFAGTINQVLKACLFIQFTDNIPYYINFDEQFITFCLQMDDIEVLDKLFKCFKNEKRNENTLTNIIDKFLLSSK